MRRDWWSFITPDSAIRTNRNGFRRRVIAEVTLSPPLDCKYLDLPSYLSDRVSGHYEIGSLCRKHKIVAHRQSGREIMRFLRCSWAALAVSQCAANICDGPYLHPAAV